MYRRTSQANEAASPRSDILFLAVASAKDDSEPWTSSEIDSILLQADEFYDKTWKKFHTMFVSRTISIFNLINCSNGFQASNNSWKMNFNDMDCIFLNLCDDLEKNGFEISLQEVFDNSSKFIPMEF